MSERDYYDILGIKRTDSVDVIKRAYRKLARQLHPDVNKSPDAASRFAEVQEAYDVLSDEEKRKQYDMFGRAGIGGAAGASTVNPGGYRATWTSGGAGGGSPGAEFDMDDLSSVFDAFFGGKGGRSTPGGPRATRAHRAQPRRGSDVRAELTVDFVTAAQGGKHSARIAADDRDQRTIDVTIPKGIANGATLRLRGEGNPAPPGGQAGDLLVTVHVTPHPLFKRGTPGAPDESSLDLFFDLPLTIAEAVNGGRIDIPTIAGPVGLTVPPGTSSGKILRLRGRGLEDRTGKHGDLYAIVQIVVPKAADLDANDRAALDSLVARQSSPRTGSGWK